MTVVNVNLTDYAISITHLAMLAEEYFGKALTNGDAGNMDFGFEPKDGNDKGLAAGFRKALDSFKKSST